MLAPSVRVLFSNVIHLCLRLIKVIVLAPLSVCFSITATNIRLRSFMYLYVPCYRHVCLSLHCVACGSQARNQETGNRATAPPTKFLKTCLVVRCNNKIESFCPTPKISAGCVPGRSEDVIRYNFLI